MCKVIDLIKTNADWIFPLIVTLVFAIIGAINSNRQKKLIETQVGISLMEKRFELFCKEREVLERIINYSKPTQNEIDDLCHAKLEAEFLFENDICEHINSLLSLMGKCCEHKSKIIPDGYGGYFKGPHDYEEEEFSQEAASLLAASINLYKRYIDFSRNGIKRKKYRK